MQITVNSRRTSYRDLSLHHFVWIRILLVSILHHLPVTCHMKITTGVV